MNVVENYRLPVTWSLGQANISWNYGFEDLVAKIAAEVGGNLFGKSCSVIVHGQQYAFNLERRVDP
jgi:hypothetical protein